MTRGRFKVDTKSEIRYIAINGVAYSYGNTSKVERIVQQTELGNVHYNLTKCPANCVFRGKTTIYKLDHILNDCHLTQAGKECTHHEKSPPKRLKQTKLSFTPTTKA